MNAQSSIDKVFQNIENARVKINEHHIVKVVAVSKYRPSLDVENLYNQGQRAFGENKVQDLGTKAKELEHLPLQWHFLGNLQSNKINNLLKLNPYLIQSLDSLNLANELDIRLKRDNKKISALLQINSSNENSKSGVKLEQAIDIYQEIQEKYTNIKLKGVMCIGALSENKKDITRSFEDTFKIYEQLKANGASICSMGMSGDYEEAIMCGSNMIRIGKALFEKNK